MKGQRTPGRCEAAGTRPGWTAAIGGWTGGVAKGRLPTSPHPELVEGRSLSKAARLDQLY